jgi:hypothetical protein
MINSFDLFHLLPDLGLKHKRLVKGRVNHDPTQLHQLPAPPLGKVLPHPTPMGLDFDPTTPLLKDNTNVSKLNSNLLDRAFQLSIPLILLWKVLVDQ